MYEIPSFLQYGEVYTAGAGEVIYQSGNELEGTPIYYTVAGLVRLELGPAGGCPITVYASPDSLFGIVEVMCGTRRLMTATSLEATILYRWDHESYQTAHSVSWELALQAFNSLTRMLRILNAEYTEHTR